VSEKIIVNKKLLTTKLVSEKIIDNKKLLTTKLVSGKKLLTTKKY